MFIIRMAGVRKEDVKVHVEDGNILEISGERTDEEEEDKSDTWHRVERRRGRFTRRFRLLENANLDGIKCSPRMESHRHGSQEGNWAGARSNVRYIDIA